VLAVVFGLEQVVPEGQLEDIAGLRPAQLQDDLRRAVVLGRDDGRVVGVVRGGAAEVDEPDLRIADAPECLPPATVVSLERI
jgi:hypothetical protein